MTYKRLPANTPAILRAAGLNVIEVSGWQTRGRDASHGEFDPSGVLCHHTATGPKTSNADVVNLLVRGRSDLPGPLCHFGLRRDGAVYMIAAGRANHAGKAKASGNMPSGDGNKLYIGIEAFNDGISEPWGAAQMNAYQLLCAVLSVKFNHNTAASVRGHKETSTEGKVDPKFDMNAFRNNVAGRIKSATVVKPSPGAPPALKAPANCPAKYGKFTHLDPSKYMNYYQGIIHQKGGGFDVDVQLSKNGTPQALHWNIVGKNHLHDPSGKIKATARIDSLTDVQLKTLRGPAGEMVRTIQECLNVAQKNGVRLELELKVLVPAATLKKLLTSASGAVLVKADKLQFKTLAQIPAPAARLAQAHAAGGITILSFTGYNGPGVIKANAFPVTNYTRGTPKWR